MFCPNCGKEIEKNLKFCPYCGNIVTNINEVPITYRIDNEKPINSTSIIAKVGYTLLGLFVFFIIVGSMSDGKSDKTKEVENQVQETNIEIVQPVPNVVSKTEEIIAETQMIEVSSGKLLAVFENNHIRANDEYKNKRVRINGVLEVITTQYEELGNLLGKKPLAVLLLQGDDEFSSNAVQCNFKSIKESEKVKNINIGDIVTIEGLVYGYIDVDDVRKNVLVTECTLSDGI